ncbi:hypothetical protein [Natronorubrum sp. DTA7]|uniref:hypothetical protein n=1 Tax=Natronorubrum sp. DTA7 TaxID=3447016 RepID=UPI003F863EA3
MKPQFRSSGKRLEIIDPIERHRYQFTVHEPIEPQPVDRDRVPYPVDTAVKITTDHISLPVINTVYVLDKNQMISEIQPSEHTSFSQGEYILDISGQIKVYALFEGGVEIYSDRNQTYIQLDDLTSVTVGARSYHRQPAGTITTTKSPTDVMQAVSKFSSALKTKSAERSFPTMRGHPPTLKLGNELMVPENVDRPKTGVTLGVVPTLSQIFTVTPLAYYLGAEMVPSAKPKILTDDGRTYSLNGPEGFEKTVERTLKKIHFFDCIVRTEGVTEIPLRERKKVEESIGFNSKCMYGESLSEQLNTYLKVPFSTVKPFLPEWRLKVQIEPIPENIPFLPFIANDLAIVKVKDETNQSRFAVANELASPTIEQSWERNKTSKIKGETSIQSYENNINRDPEIGPIEIEVICNDPAMSEEFVSVNSVYKRRDEFPFDVTIHHELSTKEFKEVLQRESDFIHYIGHIDKQGFRCSDGQLNAESLRSVGAKSFFLNACQSHHQGLHLIEAGSVSGIVTYRDVQNKDAVEIGSTIARLLNIGYSFYGAIDIVRKENKVGKQYHIVGEGQATVSQRENGLPNICIINTTNGIEIKISGYLAGYRSIGSLSSPYLESVEWYNLAPKIAGPISVTKPELVQFLEIETMPVLLDGELRWSDEITVSEI